MKIKNILLLLFIVLASVTFGQTDIAPVGGSIHIEGQIVGAENQQISLVNKNLGGLKAPIAVVQATAEGKFVMDTTIAIRDYYFLRLENGQLLNLVLSPKDVVTVYGDARDLLRMTNVIGSDHSVLLNGFLIEFQGFKALEDSLKGVLKVDPSKQAEVNAYFSPVAQRFYAYRNNFINTNQGSPALIASLNALDQEREWKEYKQVVTMLNYSFGDAPTIQNLSKFIIQKDAQMKQIAATNAAKEALFKPGTLAKEIEMPDTSGAMMKLSDLRGKVVLIDFWASWCGPCRKENPNVVKAYHKYNADGFEVFSVSLDKKGAKARWIAAIKKDGLVWPYHVCTLSGFATKAAQDYAVNSIPFTVLIDAEGKVIKTNLRGPQLEAELSRIFGH
ncbi:MAG: redoxin domain-containing protein [Crocinitomix sp.]|nr:redoxin domain-containing protein [Crocinitomix sp.]